ncbi:MAG: hypothetical protein Q9169_002733 [Polycauliona sp. 2 TL-2023]
MPSNPKNSKKRRSSSADDGEEYENDDGFVADAPKAKKIKTATAPSRAPVKPFKATDSANTSKDGDEEFWEITSNRRVNITEFKGQKMVNIREYYEDKSSGAMLPGKKGITLPLAQYSTFVTLLPSIETALAAKGDSVPRPEYGAAQLSEAPDAGEDEDDVGEEDGDGDGQGKKNFEATSEEDE